MSRRDTIIVAVLVNAGLLIVLFASALKSTIETPVVSTPASTSFVEPQQQVFAKKEAPVAPFTQASPAPSTTLGDEVDHALQQHLYASQSTPAIPAPVSAQKSFADDLRSFSLVDPSSAAPVLPAEAPKQEAVAEFIEIKVKQGDVLEKLARHNQTTVAEIMQINHLNNTNLKIGQVLKVANPALKKSDIISQSPSHVTTVTPEAKKNEAGIKYYTVKKGDNPWTIAVKNHMKVEDLLKLNNLSEDQARRLKPGDQLRIQ